jgi:type VI secretion system protein ImpI
MDSLPDGGPLSVELDQRGIDIGRDSYLDWTLPDPQRFISGKHCEVRYRDGEYWLHDVSTNGTRVNDEPGRLTEPYLLKNGDRIHIGDYIVAVALDGGGGQAAPAAAAKQSSGGDPWGGFDDVAASVDKRDFTAATAARGSSTSGRPVMGDLAEEEFSWSVGAVETPGAAVPDADWAAPPPQSRAPEAAPPVSRPAPEPDWAGPGVPPPPAADADDEEPLELTRPDAGIPGPEDEEPLELAAPPPAEPSAPLPPQRQGRLAEQWQTGAAPAPAPRAPDPAAPAPAAPVASAGSWVAAFERGAGLPPGSVARAGGDDALAEEMGRLFHIVAENLKAMLAARDETKNAMRSSQRTMIQAMENNPLKFSPTPEDAMRIMFGEKVRSYLDARQTLEASFNDLKSHQMMTFNAMQQALQALIDDLNPEKIAQATASDGGLAGLVSSRRAKLWDIYTERYKAKSGRHERGMIDAFMILFAEMYDQQGRR